MDDKPSPPVVDESKILDLTGHETPSFDEPLDPELEEIDYTNTRLREFPRNVAQLQHLKVLMMRQNLLTSEAVAANISHMTDLVHIDFYDNRLRTTILGLERLTNLRHLDISFNTIKKIEQISQLQNLTEIYLCQNKIKKVGDELRYLTSLTTLELGSNRLRVLENIETLTNLRNLWLGRNKLHELRGLENLKLLRRLDVQSNRLTTLAVLRGLDRLEELYCAHNGLSDLQGLELLTNLRLLDVAANQITHLSSLPALPLLEELWVRSFPQNVSIVLYLTRLEKLDTVYMERNPFYRQQSEAQYRLRLIQLFTNLRQIDALPVPGR